MHKEKKKSIHRQIIQLLLVTCLGLVLLYGKAASSQAATASIKYIDVDGVEKTAQNVTTLSSLVAGSEEQLNWTEGWYVADSNLTINGEVFAYNKEDENYLGGNTYLILKDGCTLTINGLLRTGMDMNLTIYCQSEGTGKLIANGGIGSYMVSGNLVSIGGNYPTLGTLTINGGIIEATGGTFDNQGGYPDPGPGIGGTGGKVIINGGTVTAKGHEATKYSYEDSYMRAGAPGIGGFYGKEHPEVIINGGVVNAIGVDGSAGISTRGNVTINGGEVNASSIGSKRDAGTGIGGLSWETQGYVQINGGVVNADGLSGFMYTTLYLNYTEETKDSLKVTSKSYWYNNGLDQWCSIVYGTREGVSDGISFAKQTDVFTPITTAEIRNLQNTTIVPATPMGDTKYQYYDADIDGFLESVAKLGEYTLVSFQDIDKTTWGDGWYVAYGAAEFNQRVNVTGDAHLVLRDNADISLLEGITVAQGATLSIYPQRKGTGILKAVGNNGAGIGAANGGSFGNIIIQGGKITATGAENAAGIGAAGSGSGVVTLYGGTINATGGTGGAGIGGGNGSFTGMVKVRGGIITSRGGTGAAGIGGGAEGSGGNLSVSGGTINATGGSLGAGIGGAEYMSFTITAGKVTANGGSNGAGIGGAQGVALTVEDGSIKATGKDGAPGIGANTGTGHGTISLGTGLVVKGGNDSENVAKIEDPYTTRTPYMTVTEQIYTVFFKSDREWQIPYCAFTAANDKNNGIGEAMEQDGEYWRYTVKYKPQTLTFFEAELQTGDKEGETAETTEIAESAPQQTDIATTAFDGDEPEGTEIDGYGSFFVIEGGCRMVTFVYNDSHIEFIPVSDGEPVNRPRPDPEPEMGYEFVRWELNGFKGEKYLGVAYNFSSMVYKSITLYAVYEKLEFTVSFDTGMEGQTVEPQTIKWLEKAEKPENPPGTVTDHFQKWVLAEAMRTFDEDGNPVAYDEGTEFDFNTNITENVKLKAVWLHTHVYNTKTYSAHMGEKYDETQFAQFNNSMHVTTCVKEGCDSMWMSPHTFDEEGICTECGFRQEDTTYRVRYFANEELFAETTRKAGQAIDSYLPPKNFYYYTLARWVMQPRDNKDVDNMTTVSYQPWFTTTVNSDVDFTALYTERYVWSKASVVINTSKYSDDYATLQLNWEMPTGAIIMSAGIMTTTNKDLNKTYSTFFNRQVKLDTSNLLKKKQDSAGYDNGLRDEMQSRMISASSYDPNKKAVIHTFPVKGLSRAGVYNVPHEVPTGNKVSTYGPWVYVMGYAKYMNAYGTVRTIYTRPVAVSAADMKHKVEYNLYE
ncbi:MAG: hypothetical protein K6G65_08810 [Lachnospiraceae bacterium]|nr:hypothetical protein [Lachnospiraceae bacterium]